jgi:hypothetical protein
VTIGDISKVRVRLDIDERFIGSVFVGQPGYVVVEAYNNRKFPGKVVEIAQRMGRKNQRTDDPTERIDTKIREVVMELEDARDLVPGLRAIGYLSETKLEAGVESGVIAGAAPPRSGAEAPAPIAEPVATTAAGGEGALLQASASVTTAAGRASAQEWDQRGAALLGASKHREAVAVYREAVREHPALRTRVKVLAAQYKDKDLELAYCLDPADKALAAAWAKSRAQRRALCAESM